ncbi:MAG TPA: PQQ-binding-like beta-propeller repeat protein [Candidatus Binatia bacterium]
MPTRLPSLATTVTVAAVFTLVAASALDAAAQTPAERITPRPLPIPGRTEWRPQGCRSVPPSHPVLTPRTAFRRAHGDLESSDEVLLAYPPVFEREWIAEPQLYQVTTPSFDRAGNLYMSPLLPHEPILMLSLDARTGERRFVVPLGSGDRGGGVVPLVLRDPESGDDVIYAHGYQRVVAVRSDGRVVWDAPTGLGPATTAVQSPIGLAWEPVSDAIVGLTRDGFLFLLDRRTGTALLPAPLQLPGEPSPPQESEVSPELAAQVDALLAPLVAFTPGRGVRDLIQVLLGGSSEIANNLSVDARRGRLWIAATARDDADGTIDGVSELGALYRFDVVRDGARVELVEACHHTFSGGSASTPTLGQDGTRVYLGDDAGALLALEAEDCSEAWRVPLDSQIFGSIAAGSDGRELFAASARGVFQVFDEGTHGRRGWTAALDLYDVPDDLGGYGGINLLLTGIGANGLLLQSGVGLMTATQSLPVRTGIVHLDRLTGLPRWFADGLEESLGAMSTGEDGALYLPQAPLRRAFSLAIGITNEPLIGGVSKWSSTRDDLLARDAACAAADRAANALAHAAECPDSAAADAEQVEVLRRQMQDAVERALGRGELSSSVARRVRALAALAAAGDGSPLLAGDDQPLALSAVRRPGQGLDAAGVARFHRRAADALGRACRLLARE